MATATLEMRDRGSIRRRVAAALVLLAIGFLLLVPDPHDHGDAGSLGGLFRLLLPGSTRLTTGGSTANADPQKTQSTPRAGQQGICPVHFWHQVAATGLLLAFLLRLFLNSEFRVLLPIASPNSTYLGSFHSRAPPILL
ncbi:MAG TPA: hypothetical protein VFF86_10635 [Candidatus Methylomirabilis sp.]|nr:hypothetical protein [Candidatus Methylomirabilis sp.]